MGVPDFMRDFNYDLKAILNSPEAEQLRLHIKKSACACTHECFVNLNLFLHARFLPKIAWQMMKFALAGAGSKADMSREIPPQNQQS